MTSTGAFDALERYLTHGYRGCIATLVHADGSTPQPVGSQMAISGRGDHVGYLTGGCAESAIASEAVAIIEEDCNAAARFGAGSPYMDIVLPCGSGIDIWFDSHIDLELARAIIAHRQARRAVALHTHLTTHGHASQLRVGSELDRFESGAFRRWYYPQSRLYIFGSGPVTLSLATSARAAEYDVFVLSPDGRTLEELADHGIATVRLVSQAQVKALHYDRWTASVLLFHEHERETDILRTLLATDVYYIGAIGSRTTHRQRLQALIDLGVGRQWLRRIYGPVGLDIKANTSAEIAISILAEMTLALQSRGDPLLEWSGGALPSCLWLANVVDRGASRKLPIPYS